MKKGGYSLGAEVGDVVGRRLGPAMAGREGGGGGGGGEQVVTCCGRRGSGMS